MLGEPIFFHAVPEINIREFEWSFVSRLPFGKTFALPNGEVATLDRAAPVWASVAQVKRRRLELDGRSCVVVLQNNVVFENVVERFLNFQAQGVSAGDVRL